MKQATANLAYTRWRKELEKISRVVIRTKGFWVNSDGQIFIGSNGYFFLWYEGSRLESDQIEIFMRDGKAYIHESALKHFNEFDFSTKCPFENTWPVYTIKDKTKEELLETLGSEGLNGPSSRND